MVSDRNKEQKFMQSQKEKREYDNEITQNFGVCQAAGGSPLPLSHNSQQSKKRKLSSQVTSAHMHWNLVHQSLVHCRMGTQPFSSVGYYNLQISSIPVSNTKQKLSGVVCRKLFGPGKDFKSTKPTMLQIFVSKVTPGDHLDTQIFLLWKSWHTLNKDIIFYQCHKHPNTATPSE